MSEINQTSQKLLESADAILIGAGAGLTAAAGISYTDTAKFAEIFPAWVRRGFSMQYQLMGYTQWSQAEQWGYYAVHLNYVYFQQHSNALYETLREVVGEKPYFVMTSNVDELFHKNGFEPTQIYTPQGSYGRIQCTVPCSEDSVWEMKPYFERMWQALDPTEQVIADPDAIPRCPNCGAAMFINARVDNSFIEKPYRIERERLIAWLEQYGQQAVALLELGAGYSTPVVIRLPMEQLAESLEKSSLIRVNMEHAQVSETLKHKSVSVQGDIGAFIEEVALLGASGENMA